MRRLPILALLTLALLWGAGADAAEVKKAGPTRLNAQLEAQRNAFQAYKQRETGQAVAQPSSAQAKTATKEAQPELTKQIEKFNQDRKPLRTIAYSSLSAQGTFSPPGK